MCSKFQMNPVLVKHLATRNLFLGITELAEPNKFAVAENLYPIKWEVHVGNFRQERAFKLTLRP